MKTKKLPKAFISEVEAKVDALFDGVKTRFLGPQATKKRLVIGFKRDLSMPGIYERAVTEEHGIPDKEHLDQLLVTAGNYIDSLRHKAKANVVTALQAFHTEASTPTADPDALHEKLSDSMQDLFGTLRYEVKRVVDTESQRARNVGNLEGIVRVNTSLGVKDPTVFFVVVRDGERCAECTRLHLLEDKKTPRVFKMGELGHGNHKRGETNPKVGGLHPHCRCTLTTLMPGFGFNDSGLVAWRGDGHDEYREQRGL
jgi:hypothetical protein